MLGRGMVSNPGLALEIRAASAQHGPHAPGLDWPGVQTHLGHFWHLVRSNLEARQQAGRLKQWLNFLRRHYPPAQQAYERLKTEIDVRVFDAWVNAQPPGATQALR
jgi:tRNA-dihydrouridine synthase C